MGKPIRLGSADGFEFGAWEALPQGEPKAGLVVIQEIFGVNGHIREVAEGYAQAGYAAVAPQIFDRVQADVELGYEADDMARGIAIAFQELRMPNTLADLQAAVDCAATYGRVGVVGYCFGGLLAWLSASELKGVAAAASYYGGGVAGEAQRSPNCPVIMHFGELDPHIPLSDVEKIRVAQPGIPIHVYPADHGFNCDHRSSFNAESAALARRRTLDFFQEQLV